MGKSSSPPPAPDPRATADAQSQYDKTTSAYNAALNRYNVNTPLGTQTWRQNGTDSSTGAPIWEQSISLTPTAQANLEQNQANSLQLAGLQGNLMNAASSSLSSPLTTNPAMGIQGDINPYQNLSYGTGYSMPMQFGYDSGGQIQTGIGNGGQIQDQLDTHGLMGFSAGAQMDTGALPELPKADQEYAKKVSDSLYQQHAQYLDPQWQQSKAAFDAQMANQGVLAGTQAYDNAYKNYSNAQQQAYSDARNNSISGGVNAMNTLFGMGLGAYNSAEKTAFDRASVGNQAASIANQAAAQQFQNRLAQGQFANTSQAQRYLQGLQSGQFANTAQAQANAQNAQQAQFGNMAQQQGYQQALGNANLYNQAAGQAYQQGLGSAQFHNAATAQDLQQRMALYNQPLNTYNALMTGSQVQMPSFQGTPTVMANAPNYQNAVNSNYQGQLNAYNAQTGSNNSFMGGLFGMGAAAMPYLFGSDIAIKQNIVKLGGDPRGFGIYEFEYRPGFDDVWGHGRHVGVIAQEVQAVMPHAVVAHPDGYLMVNYGALQ